MVVCGSIVGSVYIFSLMSLALTFCGVDLGYMINYAMFQRYGRSGYVLKPPAVRLAQKKDLLSKQTLRSFEVTIISVQPLSIPRDALDWKFLIREMWIRMWKLRFMFLIGR